MVINRIKGIHIYLHLLFQHRKLPQKFFIIIAFPVFGLQMFDQSRRIPCRLFRKKLDFCLHLTTHIFPFFLAACHPALILRCIPEMMVIHPKFLLQTDDFIFLT